MDYVIADTHFFHANIIKYCNRPFKDVQEMDEEMVRLWNSVIKPGDVVYMLGDFALGPAHKVDDLIGRLDGRMRMVLGSHDRSPTWYVAHGVEMAQREAYLYQEKPYKVWLSHEPMEDLEPDAFNIHGHIHGKPSPTDHHFCASVEQTGYRPISMSIIGWLLDG